MRTRVLIACALLFSAPVEAQETPRLLSTDSLAAWQAAGRNVQVIDVRQDIWTYLRDHLPSAQYLNIETLRAGRGGVPVQPMDAPWYRELFGRLGIDPDVPVVVYGAGETLNIDATYRPQKTVYFNSRMDWGFQGDGLRALSATVGYDTKLFKLFQTFYYTRAVTLIPSLRQYADAIANPLPADVPRRGRQSSTTLRMVRKKSSSVYDS